MKKICSIIIAMIMIVSTFAYSFIGFADDASSEPSRVINVVYDDSGSMINTAGSDANGEYVDTWCQARYSMEVFAAMLGENDTMNIYVMSDFDGGKNGKVKLSLNGSDSAADNVSKIHGRAMVTPAGNTPFKSVKTAYADLKDKKADEKWLVVLTDGKFTNENDSTVQKFFDSKSSDINVMFLGMGPDATSIKESDGVFFKKAQTSQDILDNITDICNQIFNSNKLDKDLAFDIPMKELTIFAQGENVKINGIKDSKGKYISTTTTPVSVKCPDKATSTKSLENAKADKSLNGYIATYYGDFDPGKETYTFDVTGAKEVEVFYKPNIDIAYELTDAKGNKVNDLEALEAGEYTIDYYLVKAGDEGYKIPSSKLLKTVEYSADVIRDGTSDGKNYQPGSKLEIDEGSLEINFIAKFLDYNKVEKSTSQTIYKNKSISFDVINAPNYIVKTDSITNEGTRIRLSIDGKDFIEKQWEDMEIPKVIPDKKSKIQKLKVEKTEEIGVISIIPILEDGKTTSGEYGDVELSIVADTTVEVTGASERWFGKTTITLPFKDQRSWLEKNADKIIKIGISIVVLFLILGYIPPFKKYLPKSLKSRPRIDCKYKDYSIGNQIAKGSFSKNMFSTICPYKSQTGTINYVPRGIRAPALQVKAKNSSRMIITNAKQFKERSDITFNGSAISPTSKQKEIGAGVIITVKTSEATYTCVPKNK